MDTNQSNSLSKTIFEWVFTIIAVVLLARLAFVLINLVFNFSETPPGRRLAEGPPFEFLTSVSPKAILIQIVIFVVIATILVASKREEKG